MNRIEFELLRCERAAGWHDGGQMAAVTVDPLDHPVVGRGAPRDRPVDMTGLSIDRDAIWNAGTSRDEDLDVRAIGRGTDDAAAADVEEVEPAGSICDLRGESDRAA